MLGPLLAAAKEAGALQAAVHPLLKVVDLAFAILHRLEGPWGMGLAE